MKCSDYIRLPIVLVAIFTTTVMSSCKNSKPAEWHFTGFTEVRGYVVNEDDQYGQRGGFILSDGSLNPTRSPQDGVLLTHKQVKSLKEALMGDRPPEAVAACFYPHHAFEFLDADGKRVAYVDICFSCIQHRGEPSGFGYIDYDKLGTLVRELGLDYTPQK